MIADGSSARKKNKNTNKRLMASPASCSPLGLCFHAYSRGTTAATAAAPPSPCCGSSLPMIRHSPTAPNSPNTSSKAKNIGSRVIPSSTSGGTLHVELPNESNSLKYFDKNRHLLQSALSLTTLSASIAATIIIAFRVVSVTQGILRVRTGIIYIYIYLLRSSDHTQATQSLSGPSNHNDKTRTDAVLRTESSSKGWIQILYV